MRHVIWSNMAEISPEEWKDAYVEYLEINNIDIPNGIDDCAVYKFACETIDGYLDDERANLNKPLDGRILCIADLGLWNGRRSGYKILGNNLNEIFNIGGFDDAEFYGDGYNVHSTHSHHDGTNYYEFREIREDRNIDNLIDDIYNGRKISRQKLNYYTKSLYKKVADIYGWR